MFEWIPLISIGANVVLAIVGLFQHKKKKTLSDNIEIVSKGLSIIENAIEDNKNTIRETNVGREITKTIKKYGPVAEEAVDLARSLARQLDSK